MQKLVIFFILGLTLSGCLMTRTDINEEENKKSVQQQVSRLQKNTADSESRFGEINDEMRGMNGRIETLENKIATGNQHREKSQALADQQLAETNKRVLALQEELQKLQTQTKFLNDELLKIGTAQAAAPVASSAGSTSEKKADFFKIAEIYYAKKDWKEAANYYEKYRSEHPDGKKFGTATLKIGISFQELGMKDDAKIFFDDVIAKYPNTPMAKQAKDRLKKK